MKAVRLEGMSVEALKQRFEALCVRQGAAIFREDAKAANRLYDEIEMVKRALKERDGDQRVALLGLYNHPDMQVRLKAALATLTVAPLQARCLLEQISESDVSPQNLDAGIALRMLEEGTFKPT